MVLKHQKREITNNKDMKTCQREQIKLLTLLTLLTNRWKANTALSSLVSSHTSPTRKSIESKRILTRRSYPCNVHRPLTARTSRPSEPSIMWRIVSDKICLKATGVEYSWARAVIAKDSVMPHDLIMPFSKEGSPVVLKTPWLFRTISHCAEFQSMSSQTRCVHDY